MPSRAIAPREGLITPTRLVRIIRALGPVFIKIGQFLSTRPDLIPQKYCDELLKLADSIICIMPSWGVPYRSSYALKADADAV